MENLKKAEQEMKDLLVKYPDVEIVVVPKYSLGFNMKNIEQTQTEIVPSEETPTGDVVDATLVLEPANTQSEV